MKELVVTALNNKIVWATTDGKGRITGQRTDLTSEVLRATNEWFLRTGSDYYHHSTESDDVKSYVFHTTDKEKAKQIIAILKEEK